MLARCSTARRGAKPCFRDIAAIQRKLPDAQRVLTVGDLQTAERHHRRGSFDAHSDSDVPDFEPDIDYG